MTERSTSLASGSLVTAWKGYNGTTRVKGASRKDGSYLVLFVVRTPISSYLNLLIPYIYITTYNWALQICIFSTKLEPFPVGVDPWQVEK